MQKSHNITAGYLRELLSSHRASFSTYLENNSDVSRNDKITCMDIYDDQVDVKNIVDYYAAPIKMFWSFFLNGNLAALKPHSGAIIRYPSQPDN